MQTVTIWLLAATTISAAALVIYQKVTYLVRESEEDEEMNGKTWEPHPD